MLPITTGGATRRLSLVDQGHVSDDWLDYCYHAGVNVYHLHVIGRVMPIDPVWPLWVNRPPKRPMMQLMNNLGWTARLLCSSGYYVWDVLHGDFGKSLLTARPVAEDIKRVFPATMELATIGVPCRNCFGRALGGCCRSQAGVMD
jgi:ABC-type dipeptide/oligopeptide/nickel transport system permease component